MALLRSQEATRVPALLDVRHERMLESPFAFFRGAAIVMASDLATVPSSGLEVQCCGDAHLSNFGGFASPDRSLVFDLNDFDETNPGPFEWDVKRLAASFEIAARERELTDREARDVVLECARTYRTAMASFAAMTNLETWYARLDARYLTAQLEAEGHRKGAERVDALVAKARAKDSAKALAKLARRVDGGYRIVSDPPFVVPVDEVVGSFGLDATHEQITAALAERFAAYRETLSDDTRRLVDGYRIVDMAHKVVGVGSVGTRCWIVLLLGRRDDDPLFLQIKEAQESVLEPYTRPSAYDHAGRRVVEGQRLLQAASDILLGWIRADGLDGSSRDFYVRQLWDWKLSADVGAMPPSLLRGYARMCGWTLARGHARSGDRIAISAYLGSGDRFDRAIADFAVAYADQNERDFTAAAGRLRASGPTV
ncbi:MAG TPA: DUF2252 domain-containing protein [Acidimicrobiia bacterium]|nr:DUF2252 domain-containing protein [Acidimicrobiia bacterium]